MTTKWYIVTGEKENGKWRRVAKVQNKATAALAHKQAEKSHRFKRVVTSVSFQTTPA